MTDAERILRLRAERDYWKAMHDDQVALKRMLMDRPDLKERAASLRNLLRDKYRLDWLHNHPSIHAGTLQEFRDKIDVELAKYPDVYPEL
jgi:hypothetical protein